MSSRASLTTGGNLRLCSSAKVSVALLAAAAVCWCDHSSINPGFNPVSLPGTGPFVMALLMDIRGRMATINYHFLSSPSLSLSSYCVCSVHPSFLSLSLILTAALFSDNAEQQIIKKNKHSDGKPLSLCVSQEVFFLPCSQYVITGLQVLEYFRGCF